MVNGEGELNEMIWNTVRGVQINTARTGEPEVLESVPVYMGVPGEDVIDETTIPGAVIYYLWDDTLEGKPIRSPRELIRPVDEDDLSQGYEVTEGPTYRRYHYQIDLYTHHHQDMVYLTKKLFQRLPREFGALTDDDGNLIYYRLTDITDLQTDMEEERLFRRSFTYSFDAWVQDDPDVQGTVGVVTHVRNDIHDLDTEEELDSQWIPEDPT